MSIIRAGIGSVRVFVLPDGTGLTGQAARMSGSAVVDWHSSNAGMLHQVYLNGRFAGTTIDPEQRRLVVQSPSSFETPVRVEVVAVEPDQAHVGFSDEIEQSAVSGRVKVALLRSQALPLEATANIYFDHGTGGIDYTLPLNTSPIRIWPCRRDKAGFGMAAFAAGDFGYDSAASVGFGKGVFGRGEFGQDADAIEWTSPALPSGSYRFGVRIADSRGSEGPAREIGPIAVLPAARPASALKVVTFDEQTSQLTLAICD